MLYLKCLTAEYATVLRKHNRLLKMLKNHQQILLRRLIQTCPVAEQNIESILIANRGEIACRIIETAKKMGIRTVAVYSASDASSKHVKLSDEAVLLGPPVPAHSYLNIDKILAAVRSTGAQAVHPGYGFLSENAVFVKRLEMENVAFVGPSSHSVSTMGDKLMAKRLAKEAGVNVIPGYEEEIKDADHCAEISRSLGYPVLIKASAGGGGKGMRIVRNDSEARSGYRLSTDEALSNFGDGRLLIEKLLINPRHIEIQVLGDKHGNVIHLNERECSIQRRNQKILEEAPSTLLDETTREAMANQAISLCKRIGYYSAGTVEFLVDANRNFYFLEMNTRLQVEHTVTECITGIDLVAETIRVAEGRKINFKQEDVKIKGWSIESRIYAENPYENFGRPTTGHLYGYNEPTGEGVRCDSGVEEGSLVGVHYDSLLSKLICYGKTREEAIKKSIEALDSYIILGVDHNIPLLRDVLQEKEFIAGNLNINYLLQLYPEGFKGHKLNQEEENQLLAIAVGVYLAQYQKQMEENYDCKSKGCELVVVFKDKHIPVVTFTHDVGLTVQIEGKNFQIQNDIDLRSRNLKNSINRRLVSMYLCSRNTPGEIQLSYRGSIYTLKVMSKLAADLLKLIPVKPKVDMFKVVKSPVPGLLKVISCKVGDNVVQGEELCIVEAMKMQNSIVSPVNGKIKEVHAQVGDIIADDDTLVEFE